MAIEETSKIEKGFATLIKRVANQLLKQQKNISSRNIELYTDSIITLIQSSSLETIKLIKDDVKYTESLYKKYKSELRVKLLEHNVEADKLKATYDNAKKRKKISKKVLDNFKNQYEDKLAEIESIEKDVKTADEIFVKANQFLNSQSGAKSTSGKEVMLSDILDADKKKKRTDWAKNVGLGGLSILTDSALPSMIPDGIKNTKKWFKDYKGNTKAGKAKALGGVALQVLGFMTGSALPGMAASSLKQGANADLQKKIDSKKARKAIDNAIFQRKYREERALKRGEPVAEKSNKSKGNYDLTELIKILGKTNPDIKKRFGYKHGTGKTGGALRTTGPTNIGNNFVAGEAGEETIKIIPAGKDPVVEALRKTNSLLDKLVTTNELLVDAEDDKARLSGLSNKNTKKDPKDESLFRKDKEVSTIVKKEEGSLLSGLLTPDTILPLVKTVLPVALPVILAGIGALLAGGVFTALAFGVKKYFDDSGQNAKWEKEAKERQAAKTAEKQRTGNTSEKRNKDRNSYFGISDDQAQANQQEFYKEYAKGGSFETNGPHKMVVGEAGKENVAVTPINKPMPVIIKDDTSKLGKAQLFSLKKNDILKKEELELKTKEIQLVEDNESVATPESKPQSLMSSIFSSVGTGLDYAKSAITNPINTIKEVASRTTKAGGKENEALMLQELINSGITDPKQQAIMMGQLSHESGGFTQMRELASGKAYEGRKDLGNTAEGDGEKYKGRGFIQLTGKSNYTAAGKALGIDLVNNPELAAEPKIAAKIASWYTLNRVNKKALAEGDIEKVSTSINGVNRSTGRANGIEDRYARTKGYLEGGLAQVGQKNVNTAAVVNPKKVSEGSIANVKNNATQGSEGTSLKNKEVQTDVTNNINNTKGMQQAINNVNVNNSTPPQTQTTVFITTGDTTSFASRLAKSYI